MHSFTRFTVSRLKEVSGGLDWQMGDISDLVTDGFVAFRGKATPCYCSELGTPGLDRPGWSRMIQVGQFSSCLYWLIMIDIDFGLHLAPIQEHNTCTDFTEQPRQHQCFHGHDESMDPYHLHRWRDCLRPWHGMARAIVHPQSVLVQRGFAIANPCWWCVDVCAVVWSDSASLPFPWPTPTYTDTWYLGNPRKTYGSALSSNTFDVCRTVNSSEPCFLLGIKLCLSLTQLGLMYVVIGNDFRIFRILEVPWALFQRILTG